jgi:hypothetical protein
MNNLVDERDEITIFVALNICFSSWMDDLRHDTTVQFYY